MLVSSGFPGVTGKRLSRASLSMKKGGKKEYMQITKSHRYSSHFPDRTAFVFSGIGSEWKGMGSGLLKTEPVFCESIGSFDEILGQYTNWSVSEEVTKGEALSRVEDPVMAPLCIVAVQIGLVELLRSWGVKPDGVVGHSGGEFAAAYCAGVNGLKDIVKAMWRHNFVLGQIAGKGRMAHLGISLRELRDLLKIGENGLYISAINSPKATLLAGEERSLLGVMESLEAKGVYCRMLKSDIPFHSGYVDTYVKGLEEALSDIEVHPPRIPIYSTVHGALCKGGEYDGLYWSQHIQRTVLFASAVNAMIGDGYQTFVEMSPHPVLSLYIHECFQEQGRDDYRVIDTLKRGEDEKRELLNTLVLLHRGGYPVDWERLKVEDQDRARSLITSLEKEKGEQGFLHQFQTASPERRDALLLDILLRSIHKVSHQKSLSFEEFQSLMNMDSPLNQAGLTSLRGMELKNGIRAKLGVEIPIVRFLDGSSILDLITLIGDQLRVGPTQCVALEAVQAKRQETYPLSHGQKALWFLHQLKPDSSAYHITYAAELVPDLDTEALALSLNSLILRHAPLRTTYSMEDGDPLQRVHKEVMVPIEGIDASGWSQKELEGWLGKEGDRSFDLERGPVFRVKLLEGFSGVRGPILVFTVHHIAFDFWSLDIFLHELCVLYDGIRTGTEAPLPPMDIRYGDYAVHEEKRLEGVEGERLWEYWKERLSGELPVLNLYTDHPRPPIQTYAGKTLSLHLGEALSRRLRDLSGSEGATLFMTLLAAFQVLLVRYTSQEDILIGTPTAGRDRTEWEGMIGYFVNPVVIRGDLSGNPSFKELLQRVRERVLEALSHSGYPFHLIVERLQPEQDLSRSPLFQVSFVWHQPLKGDDLKGPGGVGEGLISEVLVAEQRGAAFDLTVLVLDADKRLKVDFTYNTDLFDEGTVQRMMGHYETLLEGIVRNPEERVSHLPLLTDAEQRQMLEEWNSTDADYPRDKCIHEVFEEQVERTPDGVAVVFEDEQLTYRQLNERANQLAHYLQGLGVGPEVLVGICVERSLEMIIGILGILKAGGAYVPLDPAYPRERLGFMLEDTRAPVLLTQEKLRGDLPQADARVLYLDRDWGIISHETTEKPFSRVSSENLAYVIYTSGSTGRPKGVLIAHRGWVNLAKAQIQMFDMRPGRRVLQFSSLSFDASVWEMGMSLCSGSTLFLAGQDDLLPGPALAGLLEMQRISHVILPPSALAVMDTDEFPCLDVLGVGGEACPPELARRWSRNRRFYNAYGPTETTVCATVFEHQQGYGKLPIGRPIANIRVCVLDHYMQPVPIGVPGEVHIGGDGLARGYLNQPELTAERFIPDPFSDDPETRLYKTGDLVRYLPDGNIEFLGRMDHQVKIRGFRIELREIEAVFVEHPNVKEAAVMVQETSSGIMSLSGFFVPLQGEIPSPKELRDHLRKKLPEYMLPSAFCVLDALPLTPSRKVDRKALARIKGIPFSTEDNHVAPRTPTEKRIAEIWAKVIGIERVGIHDNFFEVGGNSLAAVQVVSQVLQVFGMKIPVRSLFKAPTLRDFSRVIEKEGGYKSLTTLERVRMPGPEGASLPILQWKKQPPLQRVFQRLIRLFFRPIARVDIQGEKNIPGSGPLIVAANHINWLDSPLIFCMASEALSRVSARPGLFAASRWRKLFHWYFSQVGYPIYVHRGHGDMEALSRALALLRARGIINIAPEGTFDRGKLIKGQVGVAYLATQASAPILPIAAYGQDRAISCWKQLGRVPLKIRMGEPIHLPPGDANHKELEAYTDQVMIAIARLLPPEYRGVYADRAY